MIKTVQLYDKEISDVKNQGANNGNIILYTCSLDRLRHKAHTLFEYLSLEEQNLAKSYKTSELSENYIISHSILRMILSIHSKMSIYEMKFILGEYGKPYISSNHQNIQFNMSHSKDIVCIVVTKDKDIGVDIEFKDSNLDVEELQPLVLSVQEKMYMDTLSSQTAKQNLFYCIWTLKEAIIKAMGIGLSHPITEINLIDETLEIKDVISLRQNGAYENLYLTLPESTAFSSVDLAQEYSIAIASRFAPKKIIHLDLNNLSNVSL